MSGVEAFTLLHPDPHAPGHGKTFYGTLREHRSRLQAYNEMGYNVFFTVNVTDGKGRRAENIIKARSLFADFDAGLPKAWPLEPTLLVQSSPGRYQAYWSLEWTEDLARWGRVERSLVKRLGADTNACDLARVFRVPGMLNHKYAPPYRVNIGSVNANVYKLDTAAETFGEEVISTPASNLAIPADLPGPEERLKRYRGWVAKCIERGGWPGRGERNGTLYRWAAKGVSDFAVDAGDAEDVLMDAWNLHDNSGDDPRIEQLVRNAERSASGVRGSAYAEPEFVLSEE